MSIVIQSYNKSFIIIRKKRTVKSREERQEDLIIQSPISGEVLE